MNQPDALSFQMTGRQQLVYRSLTDKSEPMALLYECSLRVLADERWILVGVEEDVKRFSDSHLTATMRRRHWPPANSQSTSSPEETSDSRVC